MWDHTPNSVALSKVNRDRAPGSAPKRGRPIPTGSAQTAIQRPHRPATEWSHQRPHTYHRSGLRWHKLRLVYEVEDRCVAIIKPDDVFPNLYRIVVGPDQVSDLVNLTRAKDAAVSLALPQLNREVAIRAERSNRGGR